MTGRNALAATEHYTDPGRTVHAAPRTSSRARAAADLAQLVGELGDELLRHLTDPRWRVDRPTQPPPTQLHLVGTIPPGRGASPEAALRAMTTVTVRRPRRR